MNETIRQESPSSMEINKNSKGYTYSVKAYDYNPDVVKGMIRDFISFAEQKIKELEAAE